MAGNRIYVPFQTFNARMVNMQHLWSPSTEYLGKPQEKPSYFCTVVVQKTRQNWWEEPTLAGNMAAYNELLAKSGMTPEHISEWPIKDGDMPPEPGKQPSEWAKGHWVFGGSSNAPMKVEMVQGNGVVPLQNKVGVKPGDYVALGLSAAIKQNNPRAMKHFCNTVLFMAPGEEIAVGNSVTGAELMQSARAQGFNPVGFSASPGGGFGAPPAAFQQGPGGPGGGGFTPPGAGYVPTTANPAFPGQAAPAPGGPGFGGNATFPSNPPNGQPFAAPGGPGGPGYGGTPPNPFQR